MPNDDLLKEITDNFDFANDEWADIRKEGDTDMRYVTGDPWPQDEKERRNNPQNKRLALSLDELNQYTNQAINNIRQNKRAVKISPEGGGADEQTAELHADIIRKIEGDGGQAAYITAFENAIQRSYGYFKIGKRYTREDSFDQELYIQRIPNPNTILIDPGFKEADASDMTFAFEMDDYTKERFQSEFGNKTEFKDFTTEMQTKYPHWIKEKHVQVAGYWKVETKRAKLLRVGDQQKNTNVWADQLEKGAIQNGAVMFNGIAFPILQERMSERRNIVQYVTNGIEILQVNPWEGRWIPIVPVFGREIWMDKGDGAKRKLLSLVRLARDAVMLYAYTKTAEAETIAQAPKVTWTAAEGQLDGFENDWFQANKKPFNVLYYRLTTEGSQGQQLPPPQQVTYEGTAQKIQSLMLSSEAARRAIQSALGMYNVSVGRAETGVKSGVAIKALDTQSDQGNYHFIDNYDVALEHAGRIMDNMIGKIYDSARDVPIMKKDGQREFIRINEPVVDQKTNEQVFRKAAVGEHGVAISIGPSFQSQREKAENFANAIVANRPEVFALIGDLIVKMQQLGIYGEEMAERLKPEQFKTEESPASMSKKMMEMQQLIQALTEQLNTLSEEMRSKTKELESKELIAALQADVERFKALLGFQGKQEGMAHETALQAQQAELQQRINAVAAPNQAPGQQQGQQQV